MACSAAFCMLKQEDLTGRWAAAAFYENGRSVGAKLDSIALHLRPDGGYEFRSQGFYRESGRYRVSARHLFLTDTTAQPPLEHTLKVLYVDKDTLKIAMKHEGHEQVLFFARRE